MLATDILLDDNGDEMILNGDVVTGLSDDQHIEDILVSYPGEYKQSPLIGVYLKRGINGSINGTIRRDVRLNLESDNYVVKNIQFTEQELNIDAERTS